jgi:predicted RNase H-like HicB family nuclease
MTEWRTVSKIFKRLVGRVSADQAHGYILLAYPHHYGWVALMPDFRGAMGRARTAEKAMNQAIFAAQNVATAMAELGRSHPAPLDLAAIKNDPVWSLTYGIDWTRAITQTVPVAELFRSPNRVLLEGDPHPAVQR